MSHVLSTQRFSFFIEKRMTMKTSFIITKQLQVQLRFAFPNWFFFVMIHLLQAIGFTVLWLINARLAFQLEPVKHVVMFSFRQEVPRSEIRKIERALLELPKEISQIQAYELGRDLRLIAGQIHPAGKNRAICWSASFGCASDYKKYDRHPAHVAFLKTIKPLLLPGSRAAIQYKIKN